MIATIIEHWIHPEKVEQAKALFAENSRALRKIPGLVARHVLQSRQDPLKWTAIMIWQDERAAAAWKESPDHVWDKFGAAPVIPPGTEYSRKYSNAGSVQARPTESESFLVIDD
jgi:heme-degrading monooxygenase HmoA